MIPYIRGKVSKQAHVDLPQGVCEEEFARNGFFGRYAHLYRSEAPVGWTRIEGPLKPQAFDFNKLGAGKDFIAERRPYLYNDDCRILFATQKDPMDYYFRNADADEVFFIHKGQGTLETDFGPVFYDQGDYIVIPRGTVYRLDPRSESKLLVVESFSEITLPDKGMLGQHALFDPAVMKVPNPEEMPNPPKKSEYELRIKRNDQMTKVFYPFSPINTVGWKGTLSVWQLNIKDIRPISCDRYHLPHSAHSTFVANNFVICTFLPRPLENGDPTAMKVPFYHSNIDFDEVLFYHDGEFFSREGIKPGMVTFHPQGIHHGPQKGAIERSREAKYTNEVAVMIDTKRPLKVAEEAGKIEINDYWKSWR